MDSSFDGRYANAREGKFQFRVRQDNHTPTGDTLQYTPIDAPFRIFDATIATEGLAEIQHQGFELQQREYLVDLLEDELDADYSVGDVSLREAVALANGLLGAGTVRFASSLTSVDQTIQLSQAETSVFGPTALQIQGDVSIVGPSGEAGVTISRDAEQGVLRLFHVLDTASLSLTNLTLDGGRARGEDGGTGRGGGGGGAAGLGGAILNEGRLTIVASSLTGNAAVGGNGGDGSLQISGSNGGGPNGGIGGEDGGFASGGGGGRRNGFGSPFPAGDGGFGGGGGGLNSGAGGGGGGGGAGLGGAIFNHGGQVDVINSTISGNSAHGGIGGMGVGGGQIGGYGEGFGGGIFNRDGIVNISNSTVAVNRGDAGGSGSIHNRGDEGEATLVLNSSIVADSPEEAFDLVSDASPNGSTSTSGVGNLIENQTGFLGGIVSTADPRLGALEDNGGPTPTHALAFDSPAINNGANPLNLLFDQRNAGFTRTNGPATDIGAFEFASTAPQIESVVIDDGRAQRSVVRSLTVTFDSLVTIAANAFEITDGGGAQVDVNVSTQTVGDRTIATLTFTGALTDASGSLLNGNYTLLIHGDRIQNATGAALDGDGDGQAGGNGVEEFFRLLGDSDGDRDVDNVDLFALRRSFRTTESDALFDRIFDFDGDVDNSDLFAFRRHFRTVLAP